MTGSSRDQSPPITGGRPQEAPSPALESVARSIRHHLDNNLQFRTTTRDPKSNGYAYAEIPDWALRQWLNRIEIALGRGAPIVGSEPGDGVGRDPRPTGQLRDEKKIPVRKVT